MTGTVSVAKDGTVTLAEEDGFDFQPVTVKASCAWLLSVPFYCNKVCAVQAKSTPHPSRPLPIVQLRGGEEVPLMFAVKNLKSQVRGGAVCGRPAPPAHTTPQHCLPMLNATVRLALPSPCLPAAGPLGRLHRPV